MNKIDCNIKDPINTAILGYDGDKPIKVTNEIWNTKLNVKRGDHITLIYYDNY